MQHVTILSLLLVYLLKSTVVFGKAHRQKLHRHGDKLNEHIKILNERRYKPSEAKGSVVSCTNDICGKNVSTNAKEKRTFGGHRFSPNGIYVDYGRPHNPFRRHATHHHMHDIANYHDFHHNDDGDDDDGDDDGDDSDEGYGDHGGYGDYGSNADDRGFGHHGYYDDDDDDVDGEDDHDHHYSDLHHHHSHHHNHYDHIHHNVHHHTDHAYYDVHHHHHPHHREYHHDKHAMSKDQMVALLRQSAIDKVNIANQILAQHHANQQRTAGISSSLGIAENNHIANSNNLVDTMDRGGTGGVSGIMTEQIGGRIDSGIGGGFGGGTSAVLGGEVGGGFGGEIGGGVGGEMSERIGGQTSGIINGGEGLENIPMQRGNMPAIPAPVDHDEHHSIPMFNHHESHMSEELTGYSPYLHNSGFPLPIQRGTLDEENEYNSVHEHATRHDMLQQGALEIKGMMDQHDINNEIQRQLHALYHFPVNTVTQGYVQIGPNERHRTVSHHIPVWNEWQTVQHHSNFPSVETDISAPFGLQQGHHPHFVHEYDPGNTAHVGYGSEHEDIRHDSHLGNEYFPTLTNGAGGLAEGGGRSNIDSKKFPTISSVEGGGEIKSEDGKDTPITSDAPAGAKTESNIESQNTVINDAKATAEQLFKLNAEKDKQVYGQESTAADGDSDFKRHPAIEETASFRSFQTRNNTKELDLKEVLKEITYDNSSSILTTGNTRGLEEAVTKMEKLLTSFGQGNKLDNKDKIPLLKLIAGQNDNFKDIENVTDNAKELVAKLETIAAPRHISLYAIKGKPEHIGDSLNQSSHANITLYAVKGKPKHIGDGLYQKFHPVRTASLVTENTNIKIKSNSTSLNDNDSAGLMYFNQSVAKNSTKTLNNSLMSGISNKKSKHANHNIKQKPKVAHQGNKTTNITNFTAKERLLQTAQKAYSMRESIKRNFLKYKKLVREFRIEREFMKDLIKHSGNSTKTIKNVNLTSKASHPVIRNIVPYLNKPTDVHPNKSTWVVNIGDE